MTKISTLMSTLRGLEAGTGDENDRGLSRSSETLYSGVLLKHAHESSGKKDKDLEGTEDGDLFDLSHDDIGQLKSVETKEGNDTVVGAQQDNVTYELGDDDDIFTGTGSARDSVDGGEGDDTIRTGAGRDTVDGGKGADLIDAGDDRDNVDGDKGDDTINAGDERDTVDGGDGNDTLIYEVRWSDDQDKFDGGKDTDTLRIVLSSEDVTSPDQVFDIIDELTQFEEFLDSNSNKEFTFSAFGDGGKDFTVEDVEVLEVVLDGNVVSVSDFGDRILNDDSPAPIIGDEGNNYLIGDEVSNAIIGLGGRDTIDGGVGADTLDAGDGEDVLYYLNSPAGVVVDLNVSAGGFQSASGGDAEGDVISGFANVYASQFADVLTGNLAENALFGYGGNDILHGMEGDDVVRGGDGADTMTGGDGNDWVRYLGSDAGVEVDLQEDAFGFQAAWGGDAEGDVLSGFENIHGSDQADILRGNDGQNYILGFDGNDRIDGLDGADTIRGGGGEDTLSGGGGIDVLQYSDSASGISVNLNSDGLRTQTASGGHASGDVISGFENVHGTDYDDILSGDGGRNILYGQDGNDTLNGADGKDVLRGGAGFDVFVFDSDLGSANLDRIIDFDPEEDTFLLDSAVFSGLEIGALDADLFAIGTPDSAELSDQRIIYDSTNGLISFDSDGSGGWGSEAFALVLPGLDISADDFQIILQRLGLAADPAAMVVGEDATQEAIEQLCVEFGFDHRLYVRFFEWMGQLFTDDSGDRYYRKQPVLDLLIERAPLTLTRAAGALTMPIVLGQTLGVLAALKPKRLA